MPRRFTRQGEALPYQQVSVEVVVPVHNEESALPCNIPRLCNYLRTYFPYRWSVVIADNASTDSTLDVARKLANNDPRITVLHLEEKGRGRALKVSWLASEADVVAYMDVDLSTNLWSFLPLVAPLASGHSDLAIGSRLLKGAIVTRQWRREAISRCYNLLIKLLFRNRFSDAQCGFKAIKRSVAQALLPQVENNEWFFDTELLLLAEEHGLRIYEVPVDWIEDLDSRVDVVSTALEDVKGLLRVRMGRYRRWGCAWGTRSPDHVTEVSVPALLQMSDGDEFDDIRGKSIWGESESLGCSEDLRTREVGASLAPYGGNTSHDANT